MKMYCGSNRNCSIAPINYPCCQCNYNYTSRCSPRPPFPPRPPRPPIPPCPPCPECPPNPDTPDVLCTPGRTQYLNEPLNYSGAGSISNAFNTNDGPSPYTIVSATFTGLQQAITNLQVTSSIEDTYQVTGDIDTTIIVTYLDGNSVRRQKFLNMSLPFATTLNTEDDVSDITFYDLLRTASLSNPVLTGNTLTFTYTLETSLIGVGHLRNFAMVQNYTCAIPPPSYLPTQCVTFLESESLCVISENGYVGTMPYVPIGTAPYTFSNIVVLGGPNLLSTSVNGTVTTFNMSFPVSFTLTSSDSIVTQERSEVYLFFYLFNISKPVDAQFLLDLVPQISFISAGTTSATVFISSLTGSINVVDVDPTTGLDALFVTCGAVSTCNCAFSSSPTAPN